jgi:hypothetical protein
MRKTVNFLLIGWVLGVFTFNPASTSGATANAVEAAPALAFVTGTVKDAGGAPLSGAVVTILEARLPQNQAKEIKSVKTDTLGRFTAGIVPGTYRLRAVAEGFFAQSLPLFIHRTTKQTYNFELKRDDTLVQKRGDREDYRWVGRSVPRHVFNLDPDENNGPAGKVQPARDSFTSVRPSVHGVVQLLAASSSAPAGLTGSDFFGTNFAVSGSLGNVEMAVIGQRGVGKLAAQRLAAIATMRPNDQHQVTASIGYGQVAYTQQLFNGPNTQNIPLLAPPARQTALTPITAAPLTGPTRSLDQVSFSAVDEWHVFQPLIVIYGFDYARFVSSAASQQESILPRLALQYAPTANWRVNAALTPRTNQSESTEYFSTENITAPFETQMSETAFTPEPVLDRSRRFEMGIERIFENGAASLEASAFYDVVSGHGVGVLALPLAASPETQATMQHVARQVAAMNGAARGARLMYARHFNDYVTASVGYSYGYGSRFSNQNLETVTPARMFNQSFFQVATAKLDLDFTQQTGTRISTVVRLSPSAVVFAIDPFAGRMSVYDPNINIYVTQELPSFGLPLRWQALVDIRNLLNQSQGVEDGAAQIIAARAQRTVRGGIAFRW